MDLNYYANNPSNDYCRNTITPKLGKLEKIFKEKIKAGI